MANRTENEMESRFIQGFYRDCIVEACVVAKIRIPDSW